MTTWNTKSFESVFSTPSRLIVVLKFVGCIYLDRLLRYLRTLATLRIFMLADPIGLHVAKSSV